MIPSPWTDVTVIITGPAGTILVDAIGRIATTSEDMVNEDISEALRVADQLLASVREDWEDA